MWYVCVSQCNGCRTQCDKMNLSIDLLSKHFDDNFLYHWLPLIWFSHRSSMDAHFRSKELMFECVRERFNLDQSNIIQTIWHELSMPPITCFNPENSFHSKWNINKNSGRLTNGCHLHHTNGEIMCVALLIRAKRTNVKHIAVADGTVNRKNATDGTFSASLLSKSIALQLPLELWMVGWSVCTISLWMCSYGNRM